MSLIGVNDAMPSTATPVERLLNSADESLIFLDKAIDVMSNRVSSASVPFAPPGDSAKKADIKALTSPLESRLEKIDERIRAASARIANITEGVRL